VFRGIEVGPRVVFGEDEFREIRISSFGKYVFHTPFQPSHKHRQELAMNILGPESGFINSKVNMLQFKAA
jgi:hypothetical protein